MQATQGCWGIDPWPGNIEVFNLPGIVHVAPLSRDTHGVGTGIKGCHAFARIVGLQPVIRTHPTNKFTAGQLADPVEVLDLADIFFVADIAHTCVALTVSQHEIPGSVGGGIVANNDLEVFKVLSQQGIHGPAKKALRVTYRDGETYPRMTGNFLDIRQGAM